VDQATRERTSRLFLRSLCRFRQAAVASPGLSKPRKTPNSKAFRVSSECNKVHAIDSFVPSLPLATTIFLMLQFWAEADFANDKGGIRVFFDNLSRALSNDSEDGPDRRG